MNDVATNPFFWAFLSASMIAAGDGIVSNVLPRSRTFGALVVGTFMLGRTVLVLPLCPQPRFEAGRLRRWRRPRRSSMRRGRPRRTVSARRTACFA